MEANGYVSIEAEHYTKAVSTGPITWQRLPDFGRTLSGMTVAPATAPRQTALGGASPHLEYCVSLVSGGPVTVQAYFAPTLDFTNTDGLRYAVSFDDETPQIINLHTGLVADNGNRRWEQAVASNIIIMPSQHTLAQPGEHVLKFWLVDAGLVLEKLVIDRDNLLPSYLGPPESARSGGGKSQLNTKGSLGSR